MTFITLKLYFSIVDGVYPSMAVATSGGKVLIHSPYQSSNEANDMKPQGA